MKERSLKTLPRGSAAVRIVALRARMVDPAGNKTLAFGLLAAMVALSLLLITANPAHAKTFTVNSPQDSSDIDPGDGDCDTSSTFLIPCTLRAAIEEANGFAGADTINFQIPANATKTIKPNSQLPTIYDQVTINGYTQPGASANTSATADNAVLKIELDGENAGADANGLPFGASSSNSVVKGLVINRFKGYSGIRPSSGTKVQGNFIGTDPTGTSDRGNAAHGVYISAFSSNVQIGGTTPAARNVISGNGSNGVLLYGSDNKVQGNLIGTKQDGTSDLGNSDYGVAIASSDHTVGGNTAGAANVIAFNGLDGVTVFVCGTCTVFPTDNRILGNSLHSNDVLGIDLVGGTESISGFTFNDPKDSDSGPNRLQNFPELTSATNSGGETTIKGNLNSTPNKIFTLQFFSNPVGDPPEGKKYIGGKSVSTNANGNVSFKFTPNKKVAVLQRVTATATDPNGSTSEFSVGKQVS